MKKKYGSFRTGFFQFLHIIKTEYKEGDKLPPADFMCKRLNISRNTYSKILKEGNGHAHIRLKPGCGVFVRSPHIWKVGIYLGRGEYSPMIKRPELFGKIIQTLEKSEISTHLITQPDSEKLSEELLEKNVSLLLVLDWDRYDKPTLDLVFKRTYQTTGIPVLILNVTSQETFSMPGTYFVGDNDDFAAREIFSFAEKNGFRRILSNSWIPALYKKSSPERIPCQDFRFVPKKIYEDSESFFRFLRQKKPDFLILNGPKNFYLNAFQALRLFPKKKRPAVLCYKESETTFLIQEEDLKDIRFLGFFSYDCDVYVETVADMILSWFLKKRSLQNYCVNNFQFSLFK